MLLGSGDGIERLDHGEEGDPGAKGVRELQAAPNGIAGQRRAVGGKEQVPVCHRSSPRMTSTGTLEWVRTFWVTLPTSSPLTPRRPCEAITIRSQPPSPAASMIWRWGWLPVTTVVVAGTPSAAA